MERWIKLTDEEITLANEIYKRLVSHPEVQETIKKRGFVDLRITTRHWCKLLNLLMEVKEDGTANRSQSESIYKAD